MIEGQFDIFRTDSPFLEKQIYTLFRLAVFLFNLLYITK